MWQLSRQRISWQLIGRNFLNRNIYRLKKMGLDRFEPRTYALSEVLVTTRLSVQDNIKFEFIMN